MVAARVGAASGATPPAPTAVAPVAFTPVEPELSDDELLPEPGALLGELAPAGEAAEQDEESTDATAGGDPSWTVVACPASEDDTPTLVVVSPLAGVVAAPAEAHPAGELEIDGVGVAFDGWAVAVPGAVNEDDAGLDELVGAAAGDGESLDPEFAALEDAVERGAPTLPDWLALLVAVVADEPAKIDDAPLVPPAACAGEAAMAITTAAVAKERPTVKEQPTAEEQPSSLQGLAPNRTLNAPLPNPNAPFRLPVWAVPLTLF